MKKLKDLLYNVSINEVHGSTDIEINQLVFDTRLLKQGDVFIAQKGWKVDGHSFINLAIELGAKAIICEDVPEIYANNITYILVDDSSETLAFMASNYYENPSKKLKLIGVTGTNGKTTIVTLLYHLFQKAGFKVGLISTVINKINLREIKATHTTPNVVSLNSMLNEMVSEGVDFCFMEVSSHGIHQKRTKGLTFSGGVFTNLTHDHLDYHNTFAEYRDVKKSFFDSLPEEAFALVNVDDKNGLFMIQNCEAQKHTYALKTNAAFKAKILETQFNGTLINLNGPEVWTKLIGNFNASNLLAIYSVANILGLDSLEILQIISELESVDGRFQYDISKTGIISVVDYAHTPDALINVLETINQIRTGNEKIITVVGCGGDRDLTKRPKMGHIASQLSHQVIFTADNPRSEDPQNIINEMELGVEVQNQHKVLSIVDRKQAIKTAISLASKGDIILIAGKGHENYQEIKGVRTEFDDRKTVVNLLLELKK
ncbi:MAG: UDP-N-acetylmuramoyl-L-alanyl-D-glutamate--2,6-diaminopimelate ligase [Flavobacteriaceae bacterium]|nr:UDP-N-acetylmuramoyl-L-alanyl-D-glutamate--2,6-diaminopimelate ligase [Flavobacteriaceae bacterium]